MPAYTPPGGSSTELQARNSVGLFQGITASSWDGTTLTAPKTTIGAGSVADVPTVRQFTSSYDSSIASGSVLANLCRINQTVASTGTCQGFESYARADHSTGTVVALVANVASADLNGAGNATSVTGMQASFGLSSSGAGTITNGHAIKVVNAFALGAGSITNDYGIFVEKQTRGATLNYGLWLDGAGNDASIGGDLAIGETLDIAGHSAFGSSASINGAGWLAGRYAESGMLFKEAITTTAGGGTQAQGLAVAVQMDLAAHATIAYVASEAYLETKSTNDKNYTYLFGEVNYLRHLGTGTVGSQYAGTHNSEVLSSAGVTSNNYGAENVASGGVNVYGTTNFVTITSTYGSVSTAGNAYGTLNNLNIQRTNASGTDKCYGVQTTILRGPASGGTNSVYGTWSSLSYDTNIRGYDIFCSEHVIGGSTLTGYFLWCDSAGVYRIKNDGVTAYYNPAFTKYTPDATNHERIVQQWSSNVAQIGTEAGGTGTLRPLQLLGSHVRIGGSTAAGELRILEPSGSGTNYTALKTQAQAGDITYTLPAADGSSGQVLSTNGTGTLSWATAGSGAVATDSIWDAKGDLAGGTGANTAARLAVGTNGQVLTADSAEATGLKWAAAGAGDMILASIQTVTGKKTFGSAGAVGKLAIAGTTSGETILDATAAASGTLTLPAATDTLVGKATTDTLTNKTYDTAGTGNSFAINGVAATANTGTGAVVRATSPTITTPTISGAITFPDDVRQTFNPGTTNPGLNVGAIAGDPSTPSNGDLWYDSTANELTARINGANVALGAGGSGTPGGSDTQVQFNDSSTFGGDSGFTYNKTTDTATIGNLVLTNDLPIAQGGTAASTAPAARTNLGTLVVPGLCQHRLSLETTVSFSTSDQTGKTSVFLVPHVGNLISIYDGTNWEYSILPEIGITVGTKTSGKNYDIFAFTSSATPSSTDTGTDTLTFGSATGWETGAVVRTATTGGGLTAGTDYWYRAASSTTGTLHTTLSDAIANTSKVDLTASITQSLTSVSMEWSAAWTSDTARADAIARQNGAWVKSGTTTRLYMGTIRTTSTTATADADATRFCWNQHNRLPKRCYKTDSGSHPLNNVPTREWNSGTAARAEFVIGLADQSVTWSTSVRCTSATVTPAVIVRGALDTTAFAWAQFYQGSTNNYQTLWTTSNVIPSIGYHYFTIREEESGSVLATVDQAFTLGRIDG